MEEAGWRKARDRAEEVQGTWAHVGGKWNCKYFSLLIDLRAFVLNLSGVHVFRFDSWRLQCVTHCCDV